ncbi:MULTISPECIES: hypothetical protein [Haloferax]|uniref:Uncharacterized protein n=6 Tax=Haloferax TaxID=2251 RepID=A0A384KNP1_HALVD|nr:MULTISPECIES: hypothetical protein [Haloferax]ADE01763.1 uncharacterized protein HVO_A0544 [Haloferax volcanii DS2]ELY37539.1 hypothetical protein C498_00535 [Haloferax volcanii DS2]ELZ72524.1 hypothetical protein C456_13133 [Haloferax lucentense DSM 14919]MBC9987700.1 hypothetical protein [Haloferax sp. AS1]MBS8120845.1 hypothetical protein [Haloferax volcanii]
MNDTTTRRYLAIGGLSAVLSLFVLPIAGFVSVYTGYKVHGHTKNIYSYLLAGAGSLSVLFWVAFLVRL